MQAVIIANEKSENLTALSENMPKAMLRIMNRPAVSFITELLYLNGVGKCAVVAEETVEEYLKNNPCDMEIKVFSSKEFKGSAGSLALCKDFIEEDFILIEGGCACDYDFGAPMEFHKNKNSLVTVITSESNTPHKYGNVFSDKNSKIMRICEKPGWEQVESNRVNTGIYICKKELLEHIPHTVLSFETQLIPRLLEKGEAVYEFLAKGYWNSLNSAAEYLNCNFDMLKGKIAIAPLPARRGRNFFKTLSPVYVGRGITCDRSALIGPNAIVGDNCFIGKNARLQNCIIGPNTVIGDNAKVSGIVGENCVLRPGSQVCETSLVGNRCTVGKNSVIRPNTRISHGKEIGDNLEISLSLMGEDENIWLFGERSVEGDMQSKMTPVFAARLGFSVGECFSGDIMVGFGSMGAKPFANAFCASLAAKGLKVIKSDCSVNELRYAAARNFCPCVYIHCENNRIRVFMYNEDGAPLNYVQEQKIQNAFFCDNREFSPYCEIKEPDIITGTAYPYCRDLEKAIEKTSKNVLIYGESRLCKLFRRSVNHTGGGLSDELEFEFDENGIDLKVTEKELSLDRHILCAILCLFENKKELPLPYDMPSYLLGRIGVTNSLFFENAYVSYPYFFDSLFLAGRLLNIMEKTKKSLKELYMLLPKYGFVQSEVRSKPRASVIACLKELIPAADTSGKGISITADNGVINIIPLRRAEGFKVLAFSVDTETSRELCADMCDILKNIDIN